MLCFLVFQGAKLAVSVPSKVLRAKNPSQRGFRLSDSAKVDVAAGHSAASGKNSSIKDMVHQEAGKLRMRTMLPLTSPACDWGLCAPTEL
jgi:hypothetical protein